MDEVRRVGWVVDNVDEEEEEEEEEKEARVVSRWFGGRVRRRMGWMPDGKMEGPRVRRWRARESQD